jgi:hypothetical protein
MTEVSSVVSKRVPWNKGRIVGAKRPLRPKHVWSIRTKLQIEGRSGTSLCLTSPVTIEPMAPARKTVD